MSLMDARVVVAYRMQRLLLLKCTITSSHTGVGSRAVRVFQAYASFSSARLAPTPNWMQSRRFRRRTRPATRVWMGARVMRCRR
jgi:hypothetical protein